MKKLIVTIEARMNSSRLPGKVMMEVSNKPLLIYLIENLKTIRGLPKKILTKNINPIRVKLLKVITCSNPLM